MGMSNATPKPTPTLLDTFECLECGKKFRTLKAAVRAQNKGCPKCGSTDVDLAVPPTALSYAKGTPRD